MKICACGRRYTDAEWLALPLVGIQSFQEDDGEEPIPSLELRNCSCKSTMAVEIPFSPQTPEVKP